MDVSTTGLPPGWTRYTPHDTNQRVYFSYQGGPSTYNPPVDTIAESSSDSDSSDDDGGGEGRYTYNLGGVTHSSTYLYAPDSVPGQTNSDQDPGLSSGSSSHPSTSRHSPIPDTNYSNFTVAHASDPPQPDTNLNTTPLYHPQPVADQLSVTAHLRARHAGLIYLQSHYFPQLTNADISLIIARHGLGVWSRDDIVANYSYMTAEHLPGSAWDTVTGHAVGITQTLLSRSRREVDEILGRNQTSS
jgi:hypothetical protein